MRALVLAIALSCSAAAVPACGSTQRTDPAGAALLEFETSVKDAEVWIDGQFYVGALSRGIKLKPGAHRVEIRHDDYHTQYVELTLAAGEKRTLEVQLAEILP